MNINRLLLGLFGVGLAAVFFFDASKYPEAAAQMPLIYSVIVALLSLAMIGSEMRRWRAHQASTSPPVADTADEQAPAPRRYAAVAIIFAMTIAYVMAISTLGYLLSTVAFMGLALLVIRTVSVRFAAVGTVVLTTLVCLVFVQFLGLPVPLLPPALS